MTKHLTSEQGLSVTQASQGVGLAKSTWSYQPRPRQPRPLNPELVAAIERIWTQGRGVYGYRKVHARLQTQGWRVNHKAVLRHLRRLDRLQPRKLVNINRILLSSHQLNFPQGHWSWSVDAAAGSTGKATPALRFSLSR